MLGSLLVGAAVVVFVVVAGLIVWSSLRSPRDNPGGLGDTSFISIGGIAIPAVILVAVGALAVIFTADLRPAESADDAVRIEVTGHRWWWEISYPDLGIVTANDLHVPVDRPVELTLTSGDVIHSFWVPQLAGKQDAIPGTVNRLEIRADEPGDYTGVCAEFCGIQHAHMGFMVVADDASDFAAWTDDQTSVTEPTDPLVAQGADVFAANPCGGCHTVRGSDAIGVVGPDLTELGDRLTLAGGALDNTPDDLREWITETQHVKPGALMQSFPMSDDDVDALVAYLEAER